MFDAHAHLTEELPAFLAGAILPGVHAVAHDAALLADPRVHPAVGLHPWHVPQDVETALATLHSLALSTHPVAIGETGLDKSRRGSPKDRQRVAFRAQIRLARELDLPLILHVVRTHGACLSMLAEENFTRGGMVHDFAGPTETIRDWTRAGFALSISPRRADRPKLIAAIPHDHLLVETDDAGPAALPALIQAVATARSTTPSAIAALTTANTHRVLLP
jgi:TatD DNase family protein